MSFCVSLGKLTGATGPDTNKPPSGLVAPVSLPRETQNDTGRLHLRQLVLKLDGSRSFPNLVAENWQLFGSSLTLLEQPAKTNPLLFLSRSWPGGGPQSVSWQSLLGMSSPAVSHFKLPLVLVLLLAPRKEAPLAG